MKYPTRVSSQGCDTLWHIFCTEPCCSQSTPDAPSCQCAWQGSASCCSCPEHASYGARNSTLASTTPLQQVQQPPISTPCVKLQSNKSREASSRKRFRLVGGAKLPTAFFSNFFALFSRFCPCRLRNFCGFRRCLCCDAGIRRLGCQNAQFRACDSAHARGLLPVLAHLTSTKNQQSRTKANVNNTSSERQELWDESASNRQQRQPRSSVYLTACCLFVCRSTPPLLLLFYSKHLHRCFLFSGSTARQAFWLHSGFSCLPPPSDGTPLKLAPFFFSLLKRKRDPVFPCLLSSSAPSFLRASTRPSSPFFLPLFSPQLPRQFSIAASSTSLLQPNSTPTKP